MKRLHISIACILIISIAIRIAPSISTGLPYGFDVYDMMSRIRSTLETGKFEYLPQGPMFYSLLCELIILGGISPETTSSIIVPVIFSLSVIPIILYTKKSTGDRSAAIVAGMMASSTNVIVHQTGGTVVPEGLGILFAGFVLLTLVQTNLKDMRLIVLLSFALIGTIASHHLTTMNVILGIGVATLFMIIQYSKRRLIGRDVQKILLLLLLLGFGVLMMWSLIMPQHTLEVINLTLENSSSLQIIIGGSLATFAIAAMCRTINRRRASFFLMERPFVFSILVFFASISTPIALNLAGIIDSDMLRIILYVGAPLSIVYLPLVVSGFLSIFKRKIEDRSLSCLVAFPTACLSLALFLIFQPGFGILAYREVAFMIYSILPMAGIGLVEIIRKASPANRYATAFILAYSVLVLASTSYPSRSYLLGLNEAYVPSDLRISEIVVNAVNRGASIDTDVRMGNLLLYHSGRDINWISNVSYWTNPGPLGGWLGKSAMIGHPVSIPQNIKFILVSEDMLKSKGGVVVDQPSRRFYPLPDEALLYLERKPGVSKVVDSGKAFLFQIARNESDSPP
ncbi:MAG: hypothetical protein ACUVTL_01025 [Thermoproteota archaeon]